LKSIHNDADKHILKERHAYRVTIANENSPGHMIGLVIRHAHQKWIVVKEPSVVFVVDRVTLRFCFTIIN
jgi:hypothetical protein